MLSILLIICFFGQPSKMSNTEITAGLFHVFGSLAVVHSFLLWNASGMENLYTINRP